MCKDCLFAICKLQVAQCIKLAYDSASTVDSYNSRLDQLIYAPCLCSSSSVGDVFNWLYSGARSLTDPNPNILTSQMTGMKPVSNSQAMPAASSSINFHWTVAGAARGNHRW